MNTVAHEINKQREEMYSALKAMYNPEGSRLRRYQHHLTEVLVEFDDFCKSHGINYYLAFGTLLGAVRHHGFIPWDDDVDLWMDRENYTKLEGLMKGKHHQLSENVYVNMGIRPELWSPPFAYVDIFIVDSSPDNLVLRWLKQTSARFCYAMIKCRSRYDDKNRGKYRAWDVLRPIALLRSAIAWKRSFRNVAQWFTHGNTFGESKFVQIYNNCFRQIKCKFPSGATWEVDEAEFEGHLFPVPKGADQLLEICYGDYMSIPDHAHIHTHNIADHVPLKDDK